MENACQDFGTRKCSTGDNQCYYEWQSCDQIANCPNGEDEDLAQCEDKFPSLATVTCQKKDSYNLNISVKAVPCDGNAECHGDIDELYCSLPDFIITIVLLVISVLSSIIVFVMWKTTVKDLIPYSQDFRFKKEDFEVLHGTEELNTKVQEMQSRENSSSLNFHFCKMEIMHHSGSINETICCIKVKTICISCNVKVAKASFHFRTIWILPMSKMF